MSEDMIYRQAAIDAIDEIESEVEDGDGFQYEKWRQFFCDLPSVELQPTCNKLATSCNQLATNYIRREDAIEVIEKMMEVYWDRKVVLARAWEQIKDLPSADIDLSDYSDRLWRNAYERGKAVSKDALDEAYAHGYTAAEADFHKKNQWIPVTERLPDFGIPVLLSERFAYAVGFLLKTTEGKYEWGVNGWYNDLEDWSAWMPLPEPWKGEADG